MKVRISEMLFEREERFFMYEKESMFREQIGGKLWNL